MPPASSWRRGPGTFYVALDLVCRDDRRHLARVGMDTRARADDAPWWCEGFDPVAGNVLALHCSCGRNPQPTVDDIRQRLRAMWSPDGCDRDTLLV